MPRHTRALIDLDALRANYRLAAERARPARAMAVIKADGYGHGLKAVVSALDDIVPFYAVATLEEAVQIREQGSTHPVLLLQGPHEAADWESCSREQFQPLIHSPEQLTQLQQQAASIGPMTVWLKCNTGMNRLGFSPGDLDICIQTLAALDGFSLAGIMTHFARADDRDNAMTARQIEQLRAVGQRHPELALSAANSAGHFHDADALFDWTRPGIMLYGATPLLGRYGPDLGLAPVMHLVSRIIAVREIEAGESVGYGADWVAHRPSRMGIVEIGYGDGYPRHAPSGTPVAVAGHRVPLIGRVSMDMLAVDLTDLDGIEVGAPVELWGRQIPVDEVAEYAGTISYELLTGILPRVPRHYSGGHA